MKHSRKVNLLVLGMSLITGLAIFGSTAGTLAWYAYSTRTAISFIGTSVRKSVLLNIGIVDNNGYFSDQKVHDFNLVRGNPDDEDGNDIVWTSSNSGMSATIINEYLSHSPFATLSKRPRGIIRYLII